MLCNQVCFNLEDFYTVYCHYERSQRNHFSKIAIRLKANRLNFSYDYLHGRIIKWTQHIDFLTLAGIERVVEGNHGNDFKEG